MKKILLLVLIFSCYYNSYSQDKWSIGLLAAPDFTTAVPFRSNPSSYSNNVGYKTGLIAYKQLNKYFLLNSGLILSNIKYSINKITITRTGEVFKMKVKTSIIHIPLSLNGKLRITKKLDLITSAGLVFGWGIKVKRKLHSSFTDTVKTVVYKVKGQSIRKPEQYNISFGIGAIYKVNSHLSLLVSPQIMTGIGSYIFPTTSYDFNFGLLYNFHKEARKGNEYVRPVNKN